MNERRAPLQVAPAPVSAATSFNNISVEDLRQAQRLHLQKHYGWMFKKSESHTSDLVRRDQNGDYEIGDPVVPPLDEQDEEMGHGADMAEEDKERQRLVDAVKHHQRDRNRAPSEPAELLEAVRANLRAKTAALTEDEWIYEAQGDDEVR